MSGIDPRFLEILVCPVPECRGQLELRENRLVCKRCRLRYPVQERWPVLIPEEAETPDKVDISEKPH